MKKVLITATVPSMIGQFNMSNIDILQNLGYQVCVACNFYDRSVWSEERIKQFVRDIKKKNIKYFQIDFSRSPIALLKNIKAYIQLSKIVHKEKIDLIHCHTPVAGVISRIVAHRKKVKVIYTAHGFHFFTGAPKMNWIIFYPIEKFFSRWTDVLITINKEDFNRAKKKFHAKKVVYIPGVGVDTEKFRICNSDKAEKRKELNIPMNAFVLLSVGELQDRKNQRVVIEAVHKLERKDIYYLIVGQGELENEYRDMIIKYGLQDNVFLLGFRMDIAELCKAADCFVHPSIREGLGLAPIEAMASGLPLISSYVNGIRDYTKDGISGCCIKEPKSIDSMADAIHKMYADKEYRDRCGANNSITAKKFDIKNTEAIMQKFYEKIGREV